MLVLGQAVGLETWGTFARTTRLDEVNANGTAARRALLTVNAKVRKHDVIKGNYSSRPGLSSCV